MVMLQRKAQVSCDTITTNPTELVSTASHLVQVVLANDALISTNTLEKHDVEILVQLFTSPEQRLSSLHCRVSGVENTKITATS